MKGDYEGTCVSQRGRDDGQAFGLNNDTNMLTTERIEGRENMKP